MFQNTNKYTDIFYSHFKKVEIQVFPKTFFINQQKIQDIALIYMSIQYNAFFTVVK